MLSIIFFCDILLIYFSIILLKKTFLHILNPLLFYLTYHILFVTFRILCWILVKDTPLSYLPVTINFNEIVLYKSFVLEISSLIIFMLVYISMYRNGINYTNQKVINVNLLPKIILLTSVILFILFSNIFGYQLFEFETSKSIIGTFIIGIMNWFILILSLFYFITNSKYNKAIFLVIIVAILIQALQGYGRWRLMVDILFLIILYYVKNGIYFPKIKFIHIFFVLIGFFIYSNLKYFGLILFVAQNADNLPSISNFISGIFSSDKPFIFNVGDLFIIDHQASLIKAIDNQGFFYGTTYLGNFEMFMPKYLFPNKNSVNHWLIDLKINSQLFELNGSIPTMIGESYANFGFFGPLLIVGALSYFASYCFFKIIYSIKFNIISYELIFYCAFYLSYFQIIRDGFNSVINFMFFSFFPLLFFKLINKKIKFKIDD